MIYATPTSREDLLEFHIAGTVTEADYRDILVPAIDAAIARHDGVRLLLTVDKDFAGYTAGAMFEDARLGLRHWRGFDRVAVVADPGWIASTIRAFSVLMPCPVMVFPRAEQDAARRWLTESLGAIHQTDLGGGVLHVQLLGKLEPAAYAGEGEDLDAFLRANGRIRILLDLREFDGWQGLGALAQHYALVRDHRYFVQKMAIVGTNAFERVARHLAPLFVKAEVEYFDATQFDAARQWIQK